LESVSYHHSRLAGPLGRVILEAGMARKKPKFDLKKEVRKLARERVGKVPSSRPIPPKLDRKKPKHKKPPAADDQDPT